MPSPGDRAYNFFQSDWTDYEIYPSLSRIELLITLTSSPTYLRNGGGYCLLADLLDLQS